MADYLVATCADSPEIDVTFLDYPDPAMGEYGARGVGEIGLAGVAPAITAAVYHATGVRVRELPVRIEHLLQSKISRGLRGIGDHDGSRKHSAPVALAGSCRGGLRSGHGRRRRRLQLSQARRAHADRGRTAGVRAP